MLIRCVWEHNGSDTLLYAADYPGAFARGERLDTAMGKMPREIRSFCGWAGIPVREPLEILVTEEKAVTLDVRDGDSDVLFASERVPLTREEYEGLKALALRSAGDFHRLYESIPNRHKSCLPPRRCFYGMAPGTAEEMYRHTRSVNSYYFAEIGVPADNEGTILACRERGFRALEAREDFLLRPPCEGSYAEEWSLRKVLRRFLWHDRIHGKAMYRMAVKTFGKGQIPDVFGFEK